VADEGGILQNLKILLGGGGFLSLRNRWEIVFRRHVLFRVLLGVLEGQGPTKKMEL